MRLADEFRSHLQYKIIFPFLLLTLLVGLTGTAAAYLFLAERAQDRLNNQLAQVARGAGDTIASFERANLQLLREATLAGPNTQTGAPALADALNRSDAAGVAQAVDPYYQVSSQREGVRVDRLIVFDRQGQSVVDWERPRDYETPAQREEIAPRDLSSLWFVPAILTGQQDDQGDKFAGLLDLGETGRRYVFSVAPVVSDGQVVGGMVVATRLDSLLADIRSLSSSAIVVLYRADDGSAFASTQLPADGLSTLNLSPTQVSALHGDAPQGMFDTVQVNERTYVFAYAPLRIRSELVGLLAVSLAADYVTRPWFETASSLGTVTVALMLIIIALGVYVARQITRPLNELVGTAQAVTAGDLERRSTVRTSDEIGMLASSFNGMTEHLTTMYHAVQSESSQRATIFESITDGVIVCDPHGTVLVLNKAMRDMLVLAGAALPQVWADVPLTVVELPSLNFGEPRHVFALGETLLRVTSAPVGTTPETRIGTVYVLQDVTSEINIDRAKTNFIATISHELRTPLTVMAGSAELLLRGLAGPISEDQRELVDSISRHAASMTTLINNVITLAGLDAGSLPVDPEPVDMAALLQDMLWTLRPGFTAKHLRLVIDIPADLPYVVSDYQQLRNALGQLLDNARRYTSAGSVTLRARADAGRVRVDICDTGNGIDPELASQLFTRFSRGESGINSAERGIGLGLSIARMLIERQGGALWLEHTSHEGSIFSLTLPLAHADSTDNKELASAA